MNADTAKMTNHEVCETKHLDRVFHVFRSSAYVFYFFYLHYFMVEIIKNSCPRVQENAFLGT